MCSKEIVLFPPPLSPRSRLFPEKLEARGLHPDHRFYTAALESMSRFGCMVEQDSMNDDDYSYSVVSVTLDARSGIRNAYSLERIVQR